MNIKVLFIKMLISVFVSALVACGGGSTASRDTEVSATTAPAISVTTQSNYSTGDLATNVNAAQTAYQTNLKTGSNK
jgi:hypothetical protein